MKRIVLCADDFGVHPDVSDAIVTLAEHNRLSATSCLVTSSHWPQEQAKLRHLKAHIDIGLHLNFTEGTGLSSHFQNVLPGLKPMLWRSHCHLLQPHQIEEEVRAQLDFFCETFDATPAFIDGHQHVHHLPQVRDALLKVLAEKELGQIWLRSVTPLISQTSLFKTKIIEHSGAIHFKKQLTQFGLQSNSAFAGVYSLSENESFPGLMAEWLRNLPDSGLIMCHPSQPSTSEIDHLPARIKELDFLMSPEFGELLNKNDATLHRLSHNPA